MRFCIICNYVNKIIPAIQSRCTRFRFGPLPRPEVEKRINHVVEAEKVNLTEDGRQALLKLSRGDMRRALNVMQACHAAYEVTDESAVYSCTGNPHPADIDEIMRSMMNDSFETAYTRVSERSLTASKWLTLLTRRYYSDESRERFGAARHHRRRVRLHRHRRLLRCDSRLSVGPSGAGRVSPV